MHYIQCITYYITSVTFNFFFSTLHYITLPIIHYITLHAIHYNTYITIHSFSLWLAVCHRQRVPPWLRAPCVAFLSQSRTNFLLPARQNRFCCGVFNFQKEATVHSYQQQWHCTRLERRGGSGVVHSSDLTLFILFIQRVKWEDILFYRRVWIEMSNNKVRAAASHHDWINKLS